MFFGLGVLGFLCGGSYSGLEHGSIVWLSSGGSCVGVFLLVFYRWC